MEFQIGIVELAALHIVIVSVFAGWMIIGRAPSILHATLISGCAFLNGVVAVAGLYTLLNAGTPAEQIAGFCALLFAAANAAGEYGVSVRSVDMFRAVAPQAIRPHADAAKVTARRWRAQRAKAKPRNPKKI
jgi:NAD(P) transhydrogenase subunit alpha